MEFLIWPLAVVSAFALQIWQMTRIPRYAEAEPAPAVVYVTPPAQRQTLTPVRLTRGPQSNDALRVTPRPFDLQEQYAAIQKGLAREKAEFDARLAQDHQARQAYLAQTLGQPYRHRTLAELLAELLAAIDGKK